MIALVTELALAPSAVRLFTAALLDREPRDRDYVDGVVDQLLLGAIPATRERN